jgi:hypothetical protein
MSEVVDAIAVSIGAGEAKIGSGARIEDEGLICVRRRSIREEL